MVADVLAVFAERWNDPHPLDRRTPYRMLLQRLARMPRHPEPLPAAAPPPPPAGPHSVQLLRTYGVKRPPFPFAPEGERSVARGYAKAFARARSLIYIEDQYLWSTEVAAGIAAALRTEPRAQGDRRRAPLPRLRRSARGAGNAGSGNFAPSGCLRRAAPDRVGVFDLENSSGTPIYVHAKICIIDDTWFTCGSDNFNRRSWTTDSELTCAVLDTTARGTGALRTEHRPRTLPGRWPTGSGANSGPNTWAWTRTIPELEDPAAGLKLWNTAADALDRLARNRAPLASPRRKCAAPHPRTSVVPPTPLGGSAQPPRRGPGWPPPPVARHS